MQPYLYYDILPCQSSVTSPILVDMASFALDPWADVRFDDDHIVSSLGVPTCAQNSGILGTSSSTPSELLIESAVDWDWMASTRGASRSMSGDPAGISPAPGERGRSSLTARRSYSRTPSPSPMPSPSSSSYGERYRGSIVGMSSPLSPGTMGELPRIESRNHSTPTTNRQRVPPFPSSTTFSPAMPQSPTATATSSTVDVEHPIPDNDPATDEDQDAIGEPEDPDMDASYIADEQNSLYTCTCHGKAYKRKGDVLRHLNERRLPEVCSGCGKGFPRKDPRIRHWDKNVLCEVRHHVLHMDNAKERKRWEKRWLGRSPKERERIDDLVKQEIEVNGVPLYMPEVGAEDVKSKLRRGRGRPATSLGTIQNKPKVKRLAVRGVGAS